MNQLLLQLVVIAFPGVLWERIDAVYGPSRHRAWWDVLRRTFVFGVVAYLVAYGLHRWIGPAVSGLQSFDPISVHFVLSSCLASVVCAVLWLYVGTHHFVARFLRSIGATGKHGKGDVWSATFNSGGPERAASARRRRP